MRIGWLGIAFALTFLLMPTVAQSTQLPSAPWYAVLWSRGADQLSWINPSGVAATLARPSLQDEAEGAAVQVAFSRGGRYLLQASEIADGHEALGIYDLLLGRFTGSLTAQAGMRIHFGGVEASSEDESHVAIAFATDAAEDSSWQIIIFELATGTPTAFLDSSHVPSDANAVPSNSQIRFYDFSDDTQEDQIHFQLMPKSGELPQTVPAFNWLPTANAATVLETSPYVRTMADLDVARQEEVFAFEHGVLPLSAFSVAAANYNAIGKASLTAPGAEQELIYSDRQRFLSSPRWAKGAEWIALFSESGEQGVTVGWQVIPAAGIVESSQLTALPADVRDVFGTSDGLLTLTTDGRVRHVTRLADSSGTLVYQPPDGALELIQVVYVSKGASAFTLSEVAHASQSSG